MRTPRKRRTSSRRQQTLLREPTVGAKRSAQNELSPPKKRKARVGNMDVGDSNVQEEKTDRRNSVRAVLNNIRQGKSIYEKETTEDKKDEDAETENVNDGKNDGIEPEDKCQVEIHEEVVEGNSKERDRSNIWKEKKLKELDGKMEETELKHDSKYDFCTDAGEGSSQKEHAHHHHVVVKEQELKERDGGINDWEDGNVSEEKEMEDEDENDIAGEGEIIEIEGGKKSNEEEGFTSDYLNRDKDSEEVLKLDEKVVLREVDRNAKPRKTKIFVGRPMVLKSTCFQKSMLHKRKINGNDGSDTVTEELIEMRDDVEKELCESQNTKQLYKSQSTKQLCKSQNTSRNNGSGNIRSHNLNSTVDDVRNELCKSQNTNSTERCIPKSPDFESTDDVGSSNSTFKTSTTKDVGVCKTTTTTIKEGGNGDSTPIQSKGNDRDEEMKRLNNANNNYKAQLKKTLTEIKDLKNTNKSMKLQLTETNQEMLNLKIQLKTIMINGNGGDEKQGRSNSNFTRTKSGRRVYENIVEEK